MIKKSTAWTISDEKFEDEFRKCIFPNELFDHKAHLRLAWIHIHKYGVEQAINNLTIQIKNFANSLGQDQIYHETVTIVAIRIVNAFMNKNHGCSFDKLIDSYPELLYDFRGLVSSHYSFDIFNLDESRTEYVEPDLLAFD